MEIDAPLVFFNGRRKRFNKEKHFQLSSSGEKNRDRYEVYRNYYEKIERKCIDLQAAFYEKIITGIRTLDPKLFPNGNSIQMAAIIFSNSAYSARRSFFDDLQKTVAADYYLARLNSGSIFMDVETVIENIGQQLLDSDCGGSVQQLRRLLEPLDKKPVLIIIEDILSLNAQTLEDFLLLLPSNNSVDSPFIIIAGFPEPNSPASLFSQKLLRNYAFETVQISMDSVVSELLEFMLISTEFPVQFTPKAFKLLVSAVRIHGLSCDEVLNAIRLCYLEHYRSIDSRISSAADDARIGYWIGLRILQELATRSGSLPRDLVSLVCTIADDSFLEWNVIGDLFNFIRTFDSDRNMGLIEVMQKLADEGSVHVDSPTITKFRNDLAKLKVDGRLQEEAELQRTVSKRNSLPVNPNVSSNLRNLRQGLKERQESKPVDVLELRKGKLEKILKAFFTAAFNCPSNPDASKAFFGDTDFLRAILSSSSREMLMTAFMNRDFHSAYGFYQNAGPKIDLAKWFEVFKMVIRDNGDVDDETCLVKFYKLLSEFEFIGLIKIGPKKKFAMKLCWASASLELAIR